MKISWREKIGLVECPYMVRWVLDFGPFALRLHHWLRGDDTRAFHDHNWWFCTIVLWGGYTDVSPSGNDVLSMGSIRLRPALHRHTVVVERSTWTFMITGRPSRRWYFYIGEKRKPRDKYFAENGHHPCDDTGVPVRFKPGGRTRGEKIS
jgi:hypothetical protein